MVECHEALRLVARITLRDCASKSFPELLNYGYSRLASQLYISRDPAFTSIPMQHFQWVLGFEL